jgi:hypothetical protein
MTLRSIVFYVILLSGCSVVDPMNGGGSGPTEVEGLVQDGAVATGADAQTSEIGDETPTEDGSTVQWSDGAGTTDGPGDAQALGEGDAASGDVLTDVGAPIDDSEPGGAPDVSAGDDTTGVVVVGDSGSGPIFTGSDAGAAQSDGDVASIDPGSGDDTGIESADAADASTEPWEGCAPNPCQEGPALTCVNGSSFAGFAPGYCSGLEGGGTACDYAGQEMGCTEAGASCVAGVCEGGPPSPSVGELVVTEVMRQPHLNNRHWFELYVTADSPRNLAGCGLMDGALNLVMFGASPIIVQPGQFVLVGEVSPTNDGLPAPDVTVPIGVLNLLATDEPLIVNCMGSFVDLVDLPTGTALNPFPTAPGVAMQVSPGNYDGDKNDTADLWCAAEDPYGFGIYGTPGAPNPACNADIDRCRLWYPAFASGSVGEVIEALAVVFEEGITDLTLGAPDSSPGFIGEIGIGPDGVSPELQPEEFSWFSCAPNYEAPNTVPPQDDMYGAWVIPSSSGTFDLAARFSPDAGTTWLYCDFDGSDNGYQLDKAGHVLVQP